MADIIITVNFNITTLNDINNLPRYMCHYCVDVYVNVSIVCTSMEWCAVFVWYVYVYDGGNQV